MAARQEVAAGSGGRDAPTQREMRERGDMPSTTWWSVLVEHVTESTGGQLATLDERLDVFADAVEEHDGVVGGGGSSYSVRLSVRAEDAAMAAVHAREIAWKAARLADLPEWPCVHLDAVAHDSLRGVLDAVALPEVVGAAEVSRILSISRQRLAELRSKKVDFPRPLADLAAGPVWLRPAIDRWAAGWDRRPGRPRQSVEALKPQRDAGRRLPQPAIAARSGQAAAAVPATSALVASSVGTTRRASTGKGVTTMSTKSGGKSYRSAKSGRFVTKATAKRSPATTVAESRTKGQRGKKK